MKDHTRSQLTTLSPLINCISPSHSPLSLSHLLPHRPSLSLAPPRSGRHSPFQSLISHLFQRRLSLTDPCWASLVAFTKPPSPSSYCSINRALSPLLTVASLHLVSFICSHSRSLPEHTPTPPPINPPAPGSSPLFARFYSCAEISNTDKNNTRGK
jgi:hypothetical protein